MAAMKTLAILIVLVCVSGYVAGYVANLGREVYNERECLYQGGICAMENECPKGQLSSVKGLCPKQQAKGVECCYGLPESVTHCRDKGGECTTTNCGKSFVPADDCAANEKCCIWL